MGERLVLPLRCLPGGERGGGGLYQLVCCTLHSTHYLVAPTFDDTPVPTPFYPTPQPPPNTLPYTTTILTNQHTHTAGEQLLRRGVQHGWPRLGLQVDGGCTCPPCDVPCVQALGGPGGGVLEKHTCMHSPSSLFFLQWWSD